MPLKTALKNKNIKSIMYEAWSTSWAMGLIMFFIFLIGLADVYIAGRFGKEVQAAYGLSFQLYFIFLIISMGLSIGTVSVVSRLFTSKGHEEVKVAINSTLLTVIIAGFLLSIIGVLFGGTIITALNAPREIKEYAVKLISIYSIGIIFHYLTMNTNAILRACKEIRKSVLTMGIVCTLNVGLNFYLSLHTPLGFKGIAISTVISLLIGSMLNIYHVMRFTRGLSRICIDITKKIVRISWPAGLLHIFLHVGSMAIFIIISKLPQYNVETMAAFTNGLKIESMIFLPAFAFSMANSVVVGNLLGKKEEQNAFDSGILTALLGLGIVTLMTITVMFNARTIAGFLSNNEIVIDICTKYILIALIAEPLMAWGIMLAGGLNASGDTRGVMKIVSLNLWLLRIPLSYLLGIYFNLGAVAIWWAMNISILFQTIFLTKRYFSKKWLLLAEDI